MVFRKAVFFVVFVNGLCGCGWYNGALTPITSVLPISGSLPEIPVAGPSSASISLSVVKTNTRSVSLNLFAEAASEMYLTTVADCTSGGTWEPYSNTKTDWPLPVSTFNKVSQIYVKYRNAEGVESSCVSSTLDHNFGYIPWIGARGSASQQWQGSGVPGTSGGQPISLADFRSWAYDSQRDILYLAESSRIHKINYLTNEYLGWVGWRQTASTGGASGCEGTTGSSPGWCLGGKAQASSSDGGFMSADGLATDPVGNFLFVADSQANRIVKISADSGAFVGAIGATSASTGTCPVSGPAPGWCTGGVFASSFLDGGYFAPGSLIFQNGYIYFSDKSGRAISKVNASSGAYVGTTGSVTSAAGTCPSAYSTGWCVGGSFSSDFGQGGFTSLSGLGTDGIYLYGVDSLRHFVTKIDLTTGIFVGSLGGDISFSTGTCPGTGIPSGFCTGATFSPIGGSADRQLNFPKSIVIDSLNSIFYVKDQLNYRISKFSTLTGAFLGNIGRVSASTGTCAPGEFNSDFCTGGTFVSPDLLVTPETLGSEIWSFDTNLLYVPTQKHLLVSGGFSSRIFRFNTNTSTRDWWGSGVTPSAGWSIEGQSAVTVPQREGDDMMRAPQALVLDEANDTMYVSEYGNHRISRWTISTGLMTGWIGRVLLTPSGGALGCSAATAGSVTPGWCMGGMSQSGGGDGMLNSPTWLAKDAVFLYVFDKQNHRISRYNTSTGVYAGSIGYATLSSGTCVPSTSAAWCTGGTFVATAIGSGGMYDIYGMTLDITGNALYVSGGDRDRLQKYNLATGAFLGWSGRLFGSTTPSGGDPGCTTLVTPNFTPGWCIGGASLFSDGVGGAIHPWGMAVDSLNNILLVVDNGGAIKRYSTTTGVFIDSTLTTLSPFTLLLKNNALYSAGVSWGGNYLMKFDYNGGVISNERWLGPVVTSPTGGDIGCPLTEIGFLPSGWCTGGSPYWLTGLIDGTKPWHWGDLGASAIDSQDRLYVPDSKNHRIYRIDQ